MSFLHPHAGWLLLALPLFWWWSRGVGHVSPIQRVLRLVLLGCVVLALSRPSVLLPENRPPQVIVVDQQALLAPPQREQALALAHSLIAAHPAATVLQRGGAPLALGLMPGRQVVLAGEQAASLSQSLEQALALLPAKGGAITVIGAEPAVDAHWARLAEALHRREVVLNTVRLPTVAPAPFVVAALAAPVRAGEAPQLQVELEGRGRDLVLVASSAGHELARSAPFDLQGHRVMTLRLPGQAEGFVPVRLRLASGETAQTYDTEIAVQPPRRLLYVQGEQLQGADRLRTLLGRGFEVKTASTAALAAMPDLDDLDLVMLDDVPAAQLPEALQQRLLHAVGEQGLGLFFSGGDPAFGDGSYSERPLAQGLPVRMQPQQRNEQPSVALAIVVDTSGSMRGRPLQLAKQVARLAVRRLTAADSVGVVEFYGGRQWVAPMQPARNIPEIERAISRLQAQGATEMLYAALEEAYYGLKNTPARYKHLVVLSDGGVESDRYQQLIRRIAQTHVSVSSVLVGGDSSGEATMAMWARLGQGRFYAVRDEFGTVELDFKQPQQKPEPGYHRGSVALDRGVSPPWWRDMNSAPPALAGYASTTARPEADTWLRTADGAPLLSSWQYGAGRVSAMMTEPVGAGTQPWRAWPDYGQWLSRAVGLTAASRMRVAVSLHRRFDQLSVQVRTNGDRPQLRLVEAGGTDDRLPPLQAVAPGLFVVDMPFAASRTARLEAHVGEDVGRAVDVAGSDVLGAGRLSVTRGQALARLVETTGGARVQIDDQRATELPGGRADGVWTALALAPWLAVLAVVLYLIELLYRRWPRRLVSA